MAIRAFMAMDLPASAKESLRSTMENLSLLGARPVGPENLHITLLFLGDVPEPKMPLIIAALGRVSMKSFNCAIDGLTLFPAGGPRVVSCRITEGIVEMEKLNGRLVDLIGGLGVPLEGRKFSTHLTLARCTPSTDLATLEEFTARTPGPRLEFACNEIKLKSSLLSGTGPAVHRDLFVRPLDGVS